MEVLGAHGWKSIYSACFGYRDIHRMRHVCVVLHLITHNSSHGGHLILFSIPSLYPFSSLRYLYLS